MERLDKVLAGTGRWSRREVKLLVRQGQVQVNGVAAMSAEEKIDPETAVITVGGESIRLQKFTYVMLHKPAGVLTATEDRRQATVLELLPVELRRRGLSPVGRLDKDTEGLLLLTDDGALAHDILSPAHHVEKQYVVTLDTALTEEMRRGFAAGVTLADGETMAPAGAEPLTDDGKTVLVTLRQGVYHQIKRMFGAFDAGVNALHRESIGGVALDPALAPGQWRELTAEEIASFGK